MKCQLESDQIIRKMKVEEHIHAHTVTQLHKWWTLFARNYHGSAFTFILYIEIFVKFSFFVEKMIEKNSTLNIILLNYLRYTMAYLAEKKSFCVFFQSVYFLTIESRISIYLHGNKTCIQNTDWHMKDQSS